MTKILQVTNNKKKFLTQIIFINLNYLMKIMRIIFTEVVLE